MKTLVHWYSFHWEPINEKANYNKLSSLKLKYPLSVIIK